MERRGTGARGLIAAHAAVLPVQVGVLLADSAPAALAFALASRFAYAGFLVVALRRQDRDAWFTRRFGVEGGYARFRAAALLLMHNDAVAIALACWAGRGSLEGPVPPWVAVAAGLALCAIGIGVKTWATRSLPEGSFTWRSFFVPSRETRWVAAGPYLWMRNPMYTLGYLHAWGFALLTRSVPGLAAAAAAHAGILLVHAWAERPHTERMRRRTGEGGSDGPGGAVR